MSTQHTIVLSLALAAFGFGCTPESLTDGTAGGLNADPDRLCATCHGTAGLNAAPPGSLAGETSSASMSVGAHQQHLWDGPLHKALACSDCHPVPEATTAAGHRDGVVQLAWGPLATTGGATPSFDRTTGTCSSTYCHGDFATVKGGAHTRPIWNVVDGSQKSCGSCHGFPPPAPHPSGERCADCHDATVLADGQIDLQGGKHLNGLVDMGSSTCFSCHGTPASPAPAAGAHAAHLRDGLSKALACADCHPMPTSGADSPGHNDQTVQLTWGARATTGGKSPTWDAGAKTCASNYCHGSATPLWTMVDGSQSACDSCHGAPPATGAHGIHSGLSCGSCHNGIATRSAITDPSRHVNGKADVVLIDGGRFAGGTCSAMECHGEKPW